MARKTTCNEPTRQAIAGELDRPWVGAGWGYHPYHPYHPWGWGGGWGFYPYHPYHPWGWGGGWGFHPYHPYHPWGWGYHHWREMEEDE